MKLRHIRTLSWCAVGWGLGSTTGCVTTGILHWGEDTVSWALAAINMILLYFNLSQIERINEHIAQFKKRGIADP